MAELTFSSPIFTQSAEEMAAERAILNRDGIYDPNFEMLTSDARERFLSGAVQSGMGSAIYQTVEGAYDWFSGETKDPLNFSSINEVGPGSPVTYSMGNNKEGLQKDLDTIPAKHWQYVLSASSYNEYQDRLEFVRRGMPQAQASTIGLATGIVADIGVMTLGGYLAEPIALAGLGTRTTMAGRITPLAFGANRTQAPAIAAAEAANAVSRLSLGARYTAVGVGEEVVYQFARQGLDPLYDPSFGEVVQNMVLSGSAAGLIGGVAFGRQFVADQIEDAAWGFYRERRTTLPGGYEVTYTPYAFNSTAAVDEMLIRLGVTSNDVLESWAKKANELWESLPKSSYGPNIQSIRELLQSVVQEFDETTQNGAAARVLLDVLDEDTLTRVPANLEEVLGYTGGGYFTRSDKLGFSPGLKDDTGLARFNKIVIHEVVHAAIHRRFESHIEQLILRSQNAGIYSVQFGPEMLLDPERYNNFLLQLYTAAKAGTKEEKAAYDLVVLYRHALQHGYQNDAVRAINSGKNPMDSDSWVKFIKTEGPFKSSRTLENLSPDDFAKDYYGYYNIQEFFTEFVSNAKWRSNFDHLGVGGLRLFYRGGPTTFSEKVWEALKRIGQLRFGQTPEEFSKVVSVNMETVMRSSQRAFPNPPVIRGLMGGASMQQAAAEVANALGVPVNQKVFAILGRAMVAAHRAGLEAGAFNKRVWELVSNELGPNAAKLASRPAILNMDRGLEQVRILEDMVDDTWHLFNTGSWKRMKDAPQSLVFQVLNEIRTRGGKVNRQIVGEVIEELRELRKAPPTRVNAKGRTVLDSNAQRAQIIELINRRVGAAPRTGMAAKPINISDSVLKRFTKASTARTAKAVTVAGDTSGIGGGGEGGGGTGTPGSFDGVPKRMSAFLTERIPLISPLLNQAARAMESENGAVRLIASLAFNARRATGSATKYTIFEAGSQILHSTMFTFMRGYRNSFVRFAMGRGTEDIAEDAGTLLDNWKYAFGNKDLRLQFNRRIMKQMRSGNFDDTVSAVNDAARGFKEIFEKVHNIAFEAGVAGFTKSAVVNYVPRLWRFDMIRRLATTSEGTEALTGLIEQAIAKNGRKVVIDGVEETFTGDVKAAAKVFTERLISIAKSTENAPMTEQDQELVEALGDLLGPLKAKTGSRTPFGRSRILLDESAEISTTGDLLGNGRNNLSLADLFDDDLPKVFRKYITSVMGAVNERRLINGFNDYLAANGFKGPKKVVDGVEVQEPLKVSTINEMLDTARKLGGAVEEGHLEGLKEVIAALRYEPIYSGAPKFGDKAMSLFMQYGYLTTGGQFGLAAISEVARIVGTLGVRRTFTQLPVLAEMIANYKNLDRPAQNFASFLDAWFSPSTDRLRRTFMDPLGSAEYTGPFQNAMRGATNLMSDISGLAPITSFTQQLTAATTLQHLFEFGSGAIKKGLDVGAIRSLGLEPDEYKKLAEWVASNAELKDGFLGKRVVGLKNMDAVEMDQLKKFVDRMVRTRIQDVPTRGDFHKMAFTWWGRLVTQFSTFNMKGIDNFLIQNAGRVKQGGGLQVAKEITATAMLAGLIGYGRNYADWWSFKQSRNYEEAKKREELLTLEGVVRGSFSGPSEMFLLTKGADAMWGLVDKDPLFAPYRYSGLSAFGFPGETTIRNATGVINDAKGALIGKPLGLDIERQITSKTVHMGRMLLPLQNMPGIKQYLNILETEISDEYNLNRRQPRSSD